MIERSAWEYRPQIRRFPGIFKRFDRRPSRTNLYRYRLRARRCTDARFSQTPVVRTAVCRIPQHIIRFLNVEEWRTVFAEAIGMKLLHPASIGRSYLIQSRSRQNAQNHIVVFCHYCTLQVILVFLRRKSKYEVRTMNSYPVRIGVGIGVDFLLSFIRPQSLSREYQPTFTLICRGLDFSAFGSVMVNTPFFDSADILF